jgi:hypothetical protein
VAALRNTYFNCLTPDGSAMRWEPPHVPDGVLPDSIHFGAILAELDRRLPAGGLTFHLTQDLERLPSYGMDVVVVHIGDEFARVPAYADRVRAIFKNHAVRPALTSNVLREPTWVNLWWLVAHVRMWAHHLPGQARYRRSRRGGWAAPIWRVPVGVADQLELPVKPMAERRHDLFFAGSVGHRPGAVAGLRERMAPKTLARAGMVASARRLAERHPDLSVELVTTELFAESMDADEGAYSRSLMDSRIALVPRGTAASTFRFWQALRYGCVAVVDTVPRHPFFYDGAPVVRLRDWDELEEVVVPLLADRGRLDDLHRRSLEWWRARGSKEAVAGYMAARLAGLAPGGAGG